MVEYSHKKQNSTNGPARLESLEAAELCQTNVMFFGDRFIVGWLKRAHAKEKHFKHL